MNSKEDSVLAVAEKIEDQMTVLSPNLNLPKKEHSIYLNEFKNANKPSSRKVSFAEEDEEAESKTPIPAWSNKKKNKQSPPVNTSKKGADLKQTIVDKANNYFVKEVSKAKEEEKKLVELTMDDIMKQQAKEEELIQQRNKKELAARPIAPGMKDMFKQAEQLREKQVK